ncbi:retrovirus-related pol polyprotein from transposon TNT 1-94 [Tanacetum coccineum]
MEPTLSHQRIFRSIVYVHVPSQRRSKLDDRSKSHVFVGYDKQSKGYKLYNPIIRKVVVSQDVEFDEERSWDWSIEENERYEFIPMTEEEETGELGEEVQYPQSLTLTPNLIQDSPSSSSDGEPTTRSLQELYEDMKSKKLRQAMDEEIKSIEKNDTWKLMTLPKGQKSIGVKWIYKAIKIPWRTSFSNILVKKWKIQQIDMKSAFLNGLLEDVYYVEQPEGYVVKGKEGKMLRLKKAIYCLKEAPRAWNNRIDKYFQGHSFTKCLSEYETLKVMIDELKNLKTREFEMIDIGLMSYYLGIEVKQTNEEIFICQERYAKEVLKRFGMFKCNPVCTPLEHKAKPYKHDGGEVVKSALFKSLVGILGYLTCT